MTAAVTPVRKITAQTPYGELTRKTHRVYTHVIIGLGWTAAHLKARFADELKWQTKQQKEYAAVLAAGVVPAPYNRSSTLEDYARYHAAATEKIATNAARLTKALEDNDEAIALRKIHTHAEITWAGRPDLAEKAIAKLRNQGRAIVEKFPVDQEK